MTDAIDYTVDLSARDRHLVTVTMRVPASIAEQCVLAMATWTPGSYFERHYSRHVQQVRATQVGRTVRINTPTTWSWATDADGAAPLEATFELYANELGVRNNHVDDHHALLVGAATFPFVRGHQDLPHRVRFVGTDAPVWAMLDEVDGAFEAEDHLHLVDAAFEVGDFEVARWQTAGVPHRLVWAAHGGRPDLDDVATWAAKVTDATVELFGELPVQREYTFLTVGSDAGGGGLEHRDGSVLMMPVTTMADPEKRLQFMSLVAHEYLHLWNVKRLVPAALVDPNLTAPCSTDSLWVAEGWTAWYDEVLPVRAGVWSVGEYCKRAAAQAHRVLRTPGARLQSVRQASRDAWVKQYIRDENTPNVGVNYYPHGAVLAWCLDLQLRRAAPDGHGLDDAFRLLWDRFGRSGKGYTERDVQDAVNDAAGTDLDDFFDEFVDRPAVPPLKDLVDVVGLRFVTATDNLLPELGVDAADADGHVTFASVLRDGPAWTAGLTGGDVLLAIDGQRVAAGQLEVHLRQLEPGAEVDVAVFRGPRLLHRTVTLGQATGPDVLVAVDEPSASQQQAFRDWLGADLGQAPVAPGQSAAPA